MEPIQLRFADDQKTPNSRYPLLIYKNAYSEEMASPDYIVPHLESHNWSNSWDNGIFDYNHYHSNTHEVIVVHSGYATVQFGGENGQQISIEEGDAIIIPAGVGHKCISASDDFGVIGAYPDGMNYDIKKGNRGERPEADENIAKVPMPDNDPVFGKMSGLISLWKP